MGTFGSTIGRVKVFECSTRDFDCSCSVFIIGIIAVDDEFIGFLRVFRICLLNAECAALDFSAPLININRMDVTNESTIFDNYFTAILYINGIAIILFCLYFTITCYKKCTSLNRKKRPGISFIPNIRCIVDCMPVQIYGNGFPIHNG